MKNLNERVTLVLVPLHGDIKNLEALVPARMFERFLLPVDASFRFGD